MCHRSVGLVQNLIEDAGIATVSLTTAPTVTYGVGVPRALYIRFPYGNPFGEPGNADLQREILGTTLGWLYDADGPNTRVRLAVNWRRSATRKQPTTGPVDCPPKGEGRSDD